MCSQVSESSSNIVNNDEREFSKPNNNGRYIQNEGLNRPFKIITSGGNGGRLSDELHAFHHPGVG
ncbi:hypothetical protein DERF_011468 [Dermatophagoides farinae]|uniref:Uncharacterized protein n=1 Tax=Dermatophagoides farinae TaxID=6954 RepID=A0A922HS94_DERFA|nr:hypothetical protein DERF_011468 [Dermatophagoides farinae]